MQIHWVAFEVHVAAEVEVDPLGEANHPVECSVSQSVIAGSVPPVCVELDGLGLVDESRPADLDRLVQEQVRLPHPAERAGGEYRGRGPGRGKREQWSRRKDLRS